MTLPVAPDTVKTRWGRVHRPSRRPAEVSPASGPVTRRSVRANEFGRPGGLMRSRAALLFENPGRYEVVDVEGDDPEAHEVLVRDVATGLPQRRPLPGRQPHGASALLRRARGRRHRRGGRVRGHGGGSLAGAPSTTSTWPSTTSWRGATSVAWSCTTTEHRAVRLRQTR